MSDISKCSGAIGFAVCPKRLQCRRFTAKPNGYRQSWLEPESIGDRCGLFLPCPDVLPTQEAHRP